jgi:6-phosphogluconolactonase (cycloisomerase 2 family)
MWSWVALPLMLLLSGCADGGGGDGGFDSGIQVAYVANSGSNDVSAYTISSTTGALTAVVGSPFAAGTTPNAVTVSPNGQFLYVANGGGNVSAYTIASGTGVLTAVAGSPFAAGTTPNGITVEPNGQFLYVANGGGNVSAYTITAGTGVLVPLGAGLGNPFSAGNTPISIVTPGRP